MVELDPFSEPHGHRTDAWIEVKEHLEFKDFRLDLTPDAIRQKAVALIHYRKVSL